MRGAALFAVLDGWSPWQVVALVAVVGLALATLAWAWVWRDVQTQRVALTALSTDDQAARVLGEVLGRCAAFVQPTTAGAIWRTFAGLPSEGKRALAQAVAGHVAGLNEFALPGAGAAALRIAEGFDSTRPPEPPAPPANEAEARARLEAAVAGAGLALPGWAAEEVWQVFDAAPGPCQAWLAVRLGALLRERASGLDPNLGALVVGVAREGREYFAQSSQPVSAP